MLTDTVLQRVVEALDDRREDMVSAVVEGMRATVPAYRDLTARDAELVHEGVRLTVHQFVDLLVEGRRLSAAELARIEALGGVRAAQGVPLDEMLHGVRAAMRAGWDYILRLVPGDAPAEAAVPAMGRLGDEVFDYMQQCAVVMSKGYTAHQRLGLTARVRARDDAVEELLSGVFDSDAEIERRAAALGIDLRVPHGLLLLALPADAGEVTEVLRATKDALVDRLPDALDGSVRGTPTVHAVVAVPVPSEWEWQHAVEVAVEIAADEGVLVLAAEPRPTAGGIHASYKDAARLVRIVRRVGRRPGALRPDDLRMLRFLDAAGPEEGRAFVRRVLGPVLDLRPDQRHKLLATLRALAQSGGALSEAADLLLVHAKTVGYRLRRLGELTGLDPARPLDRLQLDIAALVLELHPDC
ncbi:MAG TPA: helix-turn-helix domain-containing protein [Acidimicrobiales bacterium]|nr:helix-turn-helix domain-containing protein [Acidimicrobiales bacterium]